SRLAASVLPTTSRTPCCSSHVKRAATSPAPRCRLRAVGSDWICRVGQASAARADPPFRQARWVGAGCARLTHPTRAMKQLVVVVKPFRAEAVLQAVAELGVDACAVREAKGYGRQKSYLERYAGSEYSMAFLPKVEISVWVADDRVEL